MEKSLMWAWAQMWSTRGMGCTDLLLVRACVCVCVALESKAKYPCCYPWGQVNLYILLAPVVQYSSLLSFTISPAIREISLLVSGGLYPKESGLQDLAFWRHIFTVVSLLVSYLSNLPLTISVLSVNLTPSGSLINREERYKWTFEPKKVLTWNIYIF